MRDLIIIIIVITLIFGIYKLIVNSEENKNKILDESLCKLENFDTVIATGSNNTARYFEYYFKDKPSIIRKSRNSIAVLTGNETPEEMTLLSEDVFRYFGLGCRNVSKIFVPNAFVFNQ